MSRIIWADIGERFYGTGVDRGVLYIGDNSGVPWNGLVSVVEKNIGGEPISYYQDGFKFINYPAREESELTIAAFFSPSEFDVCDGTLDIAPGFGIKNQARSEFGFSYRTLIGNDVDNLDYGYKIHIIYNALAKASDVNNQTTTDVNSIEPMTWDISTRPIVVDGFSDSAHFVLDSRKISEANLRFFESVLYGEELSPARLPSIEEVLEMYNHTYGIAKYGVTEYP